MTSILVGAAPDTRPFTAEQIRAVVRRLIDAHRTSTAEWRAGRTQLSNLEAFNRRLAAWNAILHIWEERGEKLARDYAEKHVSSGEALDDEADNYERAKEFIERTQGSSDGGRHPPGVHTLLGRRQETIRRLEAMAHDESKRTAKLGRRETEL